MKAQLGLSTRLDPISAAAEAVAAARVGLGAKPMDAAIVVATAAWGSQALETLVAAVEAELAGAVSVGGTVDGLLAAGREIVHSPAVAVLAVHGIEAEALLCRDLAGDEERAGAELAACLQRSTSPDDLLLLFADALGLGPAPLLAGIRASIGRVGLAGLGASEPAGGPALVWAAGEVASEACAALLMRSELPVRVAVTHGGRARTPLLEVTRARDNWILGLDGVPALEVLRAALPAALRERDDAGGLLVAMEPPGGGAPTPLQDVPRVIRNVVGIDPDQAAIALPERVLEGTRLRLVSLDEGAAREDLARQLDELRGLDPAFGCYLSCRSRGEALFAHSGVESGYLDRALGGLPLLGMMGAYQLGPAGVGAEPESGLLTHSGVLALIGSASASALP